VGKTSVRPGSSVTALTLSAFMLVAGMTHFAFPRSYQRIVPRLVGDPAFWVRWSGVVEVVCAGLLLDRRTRRVGALATTAVLLAVFPANAKMALDGAIPGEPFPLGSPVVAWARVLVQIPLVVWAWRVSNASPE
jgi:uncharacterized membrane protein